MLFPDPITGPLLLAGEHPRRRFVTYGALGCAIGIGTTLIAGLGDPALYHPLQILGGALVGFCTCYGALLTEVAVLRMFTPWGSHAETKPPSSPGLERTGEGTRPRVFIYALRAVSYFTGGALGRLLGVVVGLYLLRLDGWAQDARNPYRLLFFGVFAIVVGLVLYSFEVLRMRLRTTTAELRTQRGAEEDLRVARSIQQQLLAPSEAQGAGYSLAARNLPAKVVAGDFYDYFSLSNGTLAIAVADVSGKGLGASLIMSSVKAMISLVAADRSTAGTLCELNRRLCHDLARREFVALALACFDPESGSVTLANAGLPDPYVVPAAGREGSPRTVEAPGPRLPLGMRLNLEYQPVRFELNVGDRLLLLTDGLAEARDAGGNPLGYESLAEMVKGDYESPGAWLDHLVASVELRTGPQLQDDVTLLAIERRRI